MCLPINNTNCTITSNSVWSYVGHIQAISFRAKITYTTPGLIMRIAQCTHVYVYFVQNKMNLMKNSFTESRERWPHRVILPTWWARMWTECITCMYHWKLLNRRIFQFDFMLNERIQYQCWCGTFEQHHPFCFVMNKVHLFFSFNVVYFQCANRNVDIRKAKDCKTSRSTVEILEKYGNQTSQIHAYFIPAIGIGNVSILIISLSFIECLLLIIRFNIDSSSV